MDRLTRCCAEWAYLIEVGRLRGLAAQPAIPSADVEIERDRVLLCPAADQAKSCQTEADQSHGCGLGDERGARNGNGNSTGADYLVAALVFEAAKAHIERRKPFSIPFAGRKFV